MTLTELAAIAPDRVQAHFDGAFARRLLDVAMTTGAVDVGMYSRMRAMIDESADATHRHEDTWVTHNVARREILDPAHDRVDLRELARDRFEALLLDDHLLVRRGPPDEFLEELHRVGDADQQPDMGCWKQCCGDNDLQ